MQGAAKFALGIVFLWLGMLAFFFAFHPNGVTLNGEKVKNPVEALQWLIGEFQRVSGSNTASTTPDAIGTTQASGTTTAGGRG
jgi:hypothetical protein